MKRTAFNLLASVAGCMLLLQSCARVPSPATIQRIEQADLSQLSNTRIYVRGSYWLIHSQRGKWPVTCSYYWKSDRYLLPQKIDSLMRLNPEDSLGMMQSLDSTVNAFIQLGVGHARVGNGFIEAESGRFTLVRLRPEADSADVARFFGDQRYKRSGTVYYYKRR